MNFGPNIFPTRPAVAGITEKYVNPRAIEKIRTLTRSLGEIRKHKTIKHLAK